MATRPHLDLAARFFMSTDALLSPGFSDWNSVFVKYCDGSSFTGANETATIVSGTRIFYRGATMYVFKIQLKQIRFANVSHSLHSFLCDS